MDNVTEGEDEDAADGGDEGVEEDGERLHGEGVADEERVEEEVLVLEDGEDPGGVEHLQGLGGHLQVHEAEPSPRPCCRGPKSAKSTAW